MNTSLPRPFNVQIFFPGGDPDGLKIVTSSRWNGCGLMFPRSLFSAARDREELTWPGVYVLVGSSEHSELPLIYVGEGDPIRPRLEEHASKKDFWTLAVTFTSSSRNQGLNKAHIQYLEAVLCQRAASAKRCTLENGNRPQRPSLSEADTAVADGFLAGLLLCLPALGIREFESVPHGAASAEDLVLATKRIEARGCETPQGFVVRKGSHAAATEAPSLQKSPSGMRKALVENGVLASEGSSYIFTQDYPFSSPSMAASVLLGRSSDGRVEWKTEDGLTLKVVQEAQAKGR